MVSKTTQTLHELSDIKFFVYQKLCQDHDLLLSAFPTSESQLKRADGSTCGMMFCLHGPRAVKYHAIWERDKNRLLFYDAKGKRYMQMEMAETDLLSEELC